MCNLQTKLPTFQVAEQLRFLKFLAIIALSGFALTGCESKSPGTNENAKRKELDAATAPQATASAQRMADDDFRFAAHEGQLEVVRQALEAGNNVNAVDENLRSALHMAAYNGHTEVVKLLLDKGAVVDARDVEGKTPLLHACTGPFAETVAMLIRNGADPNARETAEAFTPLMMAAGLGHVEVVRLLLENKADRDALDDDGDSALTHATKQQHTEIMQILGK